MTELMTVEQVAEHFGGVSLARARHILSDNGIRRVTGYPTDQVTAIPRPGQGARTDLAHAEDCLPGDRCVECDGCDCGGRGAIPRACEGPGCQSIDEAHLYEEENC